MRFSFTNLFPILLCECHSARTRPPPQLKPEQVEYRALLHKDWARYKRLEHVDLHQTCMQIFQSQQTALAELRKESEELYQAAIQSDDNLLPITIKGPPHTPPIKNYHSPVQYLSENMQFYDKNEWKEYMQSMLICVYLFFSEKKNRMETTKMSAESGNRILHIVIRR